MNKLMKAALAAAMLSCASMAAAAPNLVTNGDFEAAGGWTGTMGISTAGNSWAHSGDGLTGTGCVGSWCVDTLGVGSYIGQTLNTTAGSSYELSLWVTESGGRESALSVFWNGSLAQLVSNPANNTMTFFNNGVQATWVQYTFSNLLATGASTAFEIHGRQDPSAMYFDDVSVIELNAPELPEPGSLALLGIGALALMRRRARK